VPTNAAEEKLNPLSDHVGHGAEELAIAESYLSGTQGKARDSSEAAQWLWKSVGKQNAVAALLLSDLYVTGDGVPRNCDQARLLLDAAARKGVPGAGERIRDLPNVGCQ
jgi:TPR repeat protein